MAKERAAIYAARESKARTEATPLRRRSSVERNAFRIERGERIERASGRDERPSAARAQSQAKVDKGSPSRTVRSGRVEPGWREGRVGGAEEERSRRRYYRRLSEIDVPRYGTKARRRRG